MLMKLSLIFLLLCLSFFAERGAYASGFDVNDVSFLFPLEEHLIPYPEIKLNEGFLNEELFIQILKMGEQEDYKKKFKFKKETILNLKNWYIVAFRFRPCAKLRPGSECETVLSITAQPFEKGFGAIDSALHLAYIVNENDTIEGLKRIKKEGKHTKSQPLKIHPTLVNELKKKSGVTAQSVRELLFKTILKSGKTQNLKSATMIATTDTTGWKFIGGSVINNKWIPFKLPIFNQRNQFNGAQDFTCDISGKCRTSPHFEENLEHQFENLIHLFKKPIYVDEVIKSDRIKAERIDDPHKVDFFNTDCLSCHVSANARDREVLYLDQKRENGVTPMTYGYYLEQDFINILNFGYHGAIPRITPRVTNESGLSAARLNKKLKLKNSGHFCKNEIMEKLWQCLAQEFQQENHCYKKYCQ